MAYGRQRFLYSPHYIQRGSGFFSAIARLFTPVLKASKSILAKPSVRGALKTAGQIATDSALGLASSALRGDDIKEAAQEEIIKARHQVASNLDRLRQAKRKAAQKDEEEDELEQRGYRAKKKRKKEVVVVKKSGSSRRPRSKISRRTLLDG